MIETLKWIEEEIAAAKNQDYASQLDALTRIRNMINTLIELNKKQEQAPQGVRKRKPAVRKRKQAVQKRKQARR